jgi:hypothetical protein
VTFFWVIGWWAARYRPSADAHILRQVVGGSHHPGGASPAYTITVIMMQRFLELLIPVIR